MIRLRSKISFLFFIILITGININLFANEKDSIQSSLSSEKILLLKTLWSNSDNAAGLWQYNYTERMGKASVNVHHEKGNYHRFQEEQEQNKYGFYTNAYSLLDDWKFYGNFNYFSQKDIGAKWVDVLAPYNDNPYTLGDKNGGKYSKEYFTMNARAAWHANKKLNLGFDINFRAGVGARRKDPRPENKTSQFDIKPGITYALNKMTVGLNFRFQTGKESITFANVTDSTYTYYHFKGLGAFASSLEAEERSNQSILIGGGLQLGFNGKRIKNLTEINFFQKETNVKRGKTFPLQVVLLENFQTNVTSTFLFPNTKASINKLKLYFTDKHIYGHEPVVAPQLIQETYQWSTVGKYTLYWHKENRLGINYSYYKLHDNKHINWGAIFNGEITGSESTYYFVPEKNKQQLNYFSLNAAFEKEFVTQAVDIMLSLNSGIQKGFNSSLAIVSDESLLETVNTEFIRHDFDYFNQQLLQFGTELQLGRTIRLYKSATQLFVSAAFNRKISQMNSSIDRNTFTLKLGLNY